MPTYPWLCNEHIPSRQSLDPRADLGVSETAVLLCVMVIVTVEHEVNEYYVILEIYISVLRVK